MGENATIFFVTSTVVNFDPIFQLGRDYYLILLTSLDWVMKKYGATLFAYVFMPSHIHLVIEVDEGRSLSNLMRDFKKFTSTKIRQKLENEGRHSWVERLRKNASGKKGQVFKLWMDRFDDVVLFSESVLRTKVEYIHENPVKAGLVSVPEEWEFSSAKDYSQTGRSAFKIVMDW